MGIVCTIIGVVPDLKPLPMQTVFSVLHWKWFAGWMRSEDETMSVKM